MFPVRWWVWWWGVGRWGGGQTRLGLPGLGTTRWARSGAAGTFPPALASFPGPRAPPGGPAVAKGAGARAAERLVPFPTAWDGGPSGVGWPASGLGAQAGGGRGPQPRLPGGALWGEGGGSRRGTPPGCRSGWGAGPVRWRDLFGWVWVDSRNVMGPPPPQIYFRSGRLQGIPWGARARNSLRNTASSG